jgi:tRNA threonylcarbamoyladenosine biosynthesis protein TsaE
MEFLSKNTEETAQIASNFVETALVKHDFKRKEAVIVGLYGELGGGKTTFMKYLAESLGVTETIQSPTFVIEKIYDLTPNLSPCEGRGGIDRMFDKLVHIDAYRIEKEIEMINLGWSEIIADPKNLICIEWPEKIAGIMPRHTKIFFEHGEDENERKIKIELLIVNNIEP